MPERRKRIRTTTTTTSTTGSSSSSIPAPAIVNVPPPCTVVLKLSATTPVSDHPVSEHPTSSTSTSTTPVLRPPGMTTAGLVVFQQHLHYHRPEENTCLRDRELSSACFWCTEGGFSPESACFIPRSIDLTGQKIDGYGHFCSPSCALAYLRHEKIETNVLFEREYLLHVMYSNSCPCPDELSATAATTARIRPAPDPRYLLSKFCGPLSIDEFRAVSAPQSNVPPLISLPWSVSKCFPELHELSDDVAARFYGRSFRGFRNGVRARAVVSVPVLGVDVVPVV